MTEKEAIDVLNMIVAHGPLPIDAKKMAIKALEEVQQYRELEKHLSDMFGGSLSLKMCVDELERILTEPDSPHPMNAKILTYREAADWEAYRAIGTPEECRAAVEKQTAKKPVRLDKCTCPSCSTYNETWKKRRNTISSDIVYCWHCGQSVEIVRRDDDGKND